MRAVLFANGEISEYMHTDDLIQHEDVIVSVDGGMRHLNALGLTPNLIIGDFDSIETGYLKTTGENGVEVLRYPPAKDETDLELALQIIKERGFDSCLIVGALGGRIDQTLANIWLLAALDAPAFKISLDDGVERVDLITGSLTVHGSPGDIVSLIPFSAPVAGIITEGLEYPLLGETLFPERTRGLSNVLTERSAHIKIESGRLLCIHKRETAIRKEAT